MCDLERVALLDQSVKHRRVRVQPSLDQITVGDIVRFLLWLSDEEREQAIELLRAIQDQLRREIWREPLIFSENG